MVLFKSADDILILRENFTGKIVLQEQGEEVQYIIENGIIKEKICQSSQ